MILERNLFGVQELPLLNQVLIFNSFAENLTGLRPHNAQDPGFIGHILDRNLPASFSCHLQNILRMSLGFLTIVNFKLRDYLKFSL